MTYVQKETAIEGGVSNQAPCRNTGIHHVGLRATNPVASAVSKIGAVFYIIWGCLHLLAAYSVYALGRSLDSSVVQGRVFQDAWNLVFFAIIAISVAATLNWRNSVWGYWINFATVGIADTGFIFFVLVPGYAPVWPGILGPVFWVLATIFSTIALLTRTKGATRSLTGDNTQVAGAAD